MFYILKIYIGEFNQFSNFELDLTYPSGPKKGLPLDNVCFIGKNGTGKSTLLQFIEQVLTDFRSAYQFSYSWVAKIRIDENNYYTFNIQGAARHPMLNFFQEGIESVDSYKDLIYSYFKTSTVPGEFGKYRVVSNFNKDSPPILPSDIPRLLPSIRDSLNKPNRLLITVPADSNLSIYKGLSDMPSADVNSAIRMDQAKYKHIVSPETINEFWLTLIYFIKKRESDLLIFNSLEENQNRVVKDVRADFEIKNPQILYQISELWNNILEKGGLEFDVEKAIIPIQLHENLRAYIKNKRNNKSINYSSLSTGIRNFIFTVGHIYSLYFQKTIEQGYLIIDEPENSLFPDLLYDLISLYKKITKNTQLFVSTHSPIIAAQFEPSERVLLDFAEDGSITSSRGVTPMGDDPNDILLKDFHIKSLLGAEGIKKWERYIELRLLIQKSNNPEQKRKLIKEYLEIGNAYEFGATETE